MTMTKDDLVAAIQTGATCTKGAAEKAYDNLIAAIASAISDDGEVLLRGLGTLKKIRTEARDGRNPRTGEPISIPAGYHVKFKAGKSLRDRLASAGAPSGH